MRAIGLQYADSCFHYVVLSDAGDVFVRKTIRANYDELRREFRAFEPTCVAIEASASTKWAVDLLTRLNHAVQVAPCLPEMGLTSESRAEHHARHLRTLWNRGIAAMRAAAQDTALRA